MSSAIDQERDKWDEYYAKLSHEADELPEAKALYREVAEVVTQLLPKPGSVLEAGCGSGMHSLALARLGELEVSLLDFSAHAIEHAKGVFDREGVRASFAVGDVFEGLCSPEHDLVFNSGVLEHYEFARQVRFLEGMKNRSRRFVLVLVPNRDCYWYWIWRIQEQAEGRWPFGYEKPSVDYQAAIEAAGLHYLGKTYFGAAAGMRLIASVRGLSPDLQELIGGVHEHLIASPEQRSYMVGFLASVDAETAVPGRFIPAGEGRAYLTRDLEDRYIALLGDSLATQITVQQRLVAKEEALERALVRLGELEGNCRELSQELGEARREAEFAKQGVARIQASTSWKLTAPVRALGRLLRGAI